ncbi:hypothetical protein [Nocardia harenae]|uniref:hypothetical protein n=1 Tax=Nocardia harenae TaxID=358707 RepID=UPI000833AFDC|nr:hypothetical protein [Nocardia harenae]
MKILRLPLLLTGVLLAGTAVACAGADSAPTGIALVNADTGPTGAKVAQQLAQDGGGYSWTAVAPGEVDAGAFAAVVTLPADLTEAMGTLATDRPHRATLNVRSHPDADSAFVDGAVDLVTHRIGAAGVDAALAATANARSRMTGVQFTAQLLNAGVAAAATGAEQFSGGAEQLLGFLDFAKTGAASLTSAVELLNETVDGAAAQADQLAGALDTTGVTIAQVEGTANTVGAGLDQVVPLLRALPFADDPALAEIIARLEGLRGVAAQAGTQLTGLGELVGGAVDPETDLGTLLRTVVARLRDASTQLGQGAELAKDLPRLAEQGGAQLLDAIAQLTAGITQLRTVVGNLNTQTDAAVSALPARPAPQQSAIALALTDPVEVVRD